MHTTEQSKGFMYSVQGAHHFKVGVCVGPTTEGTTCLGKSVCGNGGGFYGGTLSVSLNYCMNIIIIIE